MGRELPGGTVTFLFTDVESSTRLLQELGAERYADALAEHRRILRDAFRRHGGVEVDTQGDAFFVAFPTAPAALAAATEADRALAATLIRVRMGLHTGTPLVTAEGYVGPDVHRAARIAAAGHGGQILASASTVSLVDAAELHDLGEHRLKDLGAPERIYQVGDEEFPSLKSLQQTNLPVPATGFLGRERELDEVTALLAGEVRLLTLTGPAGAGKTRLALQAAAEASDHFPDGVFWAPLAALRDPKLVLEVAAHALEARNGLDERIGDRRLLLLLDNFEHVIDAADDLAETLAACPNLRLVVTSRELLRLPGEQAYPVSPLEPRDATELFTARAQAVDPGFAPGSVVTELCSRLDNLPLALELAAARVPVLSPEQLLDRLAERLDLLKAGRGVDPRQQTLRATIEWSYELLDDQERLLFERLSIFRGGCTLEAAEAVCEADVDTLESLIDKSLVRRYGDRFWMLETLREFASQQLEGRGGGAAVLADRHANYFQSLAAKARRGAPDNHPEEGSALYAELDNVRSALDTVVASGDVERELRLVTAAFWGLWTQASLRELRGWLESALERAPEDVDPGLRGEVLGAAALAAANTGQRERAREYARELLALARELGDKRQTEWALRVLSFDEPDLEERRRLLRECEQLLHELHNEAGLGWVTFLLAQTLADERRFEEASETFEQAVAIFDGLGRGWEAANAAIGLAYAMVSADHGAEARLILKGTLQTARTLDSVVLATESLAGLGFVCAGRDPATAARILAAAETLAEERGHSLSIEWERSAVGEAARLVRDDLASRFEAEWEAGRGLTVEQATALGLDL